MRYLIWLGANEQVHSEILTLYYHTTKQPSSNQATVWSPFPVIALDTLQSVQGMRLVADEAVHHTCVVSGGGLGVAEC